MQLACSALPSIVNSESTGRRAKLSENGLVGVCLNGAKKVGENSPNLSAQSDDNKGR